MSDKTTEENIISCPMQKHSKCQGNRCALFFRNREMQVCGVMAGIISLIRIANSLEEPMPIPQAGEIVIPGLRPVK